MPQKSEERKKEQSFPVSFALELGEKLHHNLHFTKNDIISVQPLINLYIGKFGQKAMLSCFIPQIRLILTV